MQLYQIDGTEYPGVWVTEYKRTFSIADTDKSGRSLDGLMHRDIIGTFYNYEITFHRSQSCTSTTWENLWNTLSSPQNSHSCTFWNGQAMLTQDMYITDGAQDLTKRENGVNYWDDIECKFVAMAPYRRP